MGRIITAGRSFKSASPGTYVARCYRIVDIGTQHTIWVDEPKSRNQIIVFWELPTETAEFDGEIKPLSISKFYTTSLHEKSTLRRDLKAWRGRDFTEEEVAGFDLQNIIGKPCILTIALSETGKTEVSGVSPLMKGQTCPPQVNTSQAFWLDDYSDVQFDALSDGLKRLVQKSAEYKKIKGIVPEAVVRVGIDNVEVDDITKNDLPF